MPNANPAARPETYCVPVGQAQSELVIKNSVFVATVEHAATLDEAHAFIDRIRALYADANHNAWAFRLSAGPQEQIGSSDDGEPGGTAGRPILAVLEGSGLIEIVAVVTRYFGGVKLGTGGLVRAYGGAAREALKDLATRELVLHHIGRFSVDYALYGSLRYLLPRHGVRTVGEAFTDRVTLEVAVPYDQVAPLAEQLRELSNGELNLAAAWVDERYEERMAGA